VVNESDPPRRLDLNKHFLNLTATKLPDLLKEPLRGRLGRFQPVNSARWQLRPLVRSKDGIIDILDNWPGDESRKPQLGDHVNLASLTKRLEDELNVLTNLAELDKKISDAASAIQTNVDSDVVPLGTWLQLTNADLESFKAYKAQHAHKRSPAVYLDYLDQVAKQARPEIGKWAVPRGPREATIVEGLQDLHERCVKHFKQHPEPLALLTLPGRTTNYFLAVWENLKYQEIEMAQRQEKKETEGKIDELKTWLKRIPSRLDQLAALSLCVVGPNDKHLEMIRFSIASASKSP
jgi:hypothetical protein